MGRLNHIVKSRHGYLEEAENQITMKTTKLCADPSAVAFSGG